MATAVFQYTPGDSFDNGTLHAKRLDTGAETSQALVSGANSVTVTSGATYSFWAVAYNSVNAYIGMSGPVLQYIPYLDAGDDLLIRWHTDYDSSWLSAGISASEERIRLPLNRRGHWLQWEIKGQGQNQRFTLRNHALNVRMHGESYGARQS